MSPYAQTRIQLLNELLRRRLPPGDINRISEAYHLAISIFTGLVRPSGKTFIDHAVATASILAAFDSRAEVVAAGLLHAAYTHGDFGTIRRGLSPSCRLEVSRAIGDEAENLVAKYTLSKWNSQTIPVYRHKLPTLERDEREVLLIRLANELEDHLDLGVLYCFDAVLRRDFARRCGPMAVEIARQLGYPRLSEELEQVYRETASEDVPEELRHAGSRTRAHRIAPRSRCRRRSAAAWDFIHRAVNRYWISEPSPL